MARKLNAGQGLDPVFEAIDALTFREHRSLAGLLAMQAEGRDLTDEAVFADLLADELDSHFETEDEEDAS